MWKGIKHSWREAEMETERVWGQREGEGEKRERAMLFYVKYFGVLVLWQLCKPFLNSNDEHWM